MTDCIFCKIVKGEIPSAKLYEDEQSLAILDINPLTPGHTLLMTKGHYPALLDAPSETTAHLIKTSYQIVKAVVNGMKADGYNLLLNNGRCAGQLIPHLHFHIIPRRTDDGVHFHWSPRNYAKGEMEKVAQEIRNHLK